MMHDNYDFGNARNSPQTGLLHHTYQEDKTFFREDSGYCDEAEEGFKLGRFTHDRSYFKAKQKYEIGMSIKHLITFFLYHFLFLFTIGPFIIFFFLPFPNRIAYIRTLYNIMLLRVWSKKFWVYFIWWMFNILVIGGYHFDYYVGTELITPIIYYSLMVNGLLRIFSISATYATLPNYIQDLMRHHTLETDVLNQEDLLEDWTRQDPGIIKENIGGAVFSAQLDVSILWTSFMAQPLESTHAHLSAISLTLNNCELDETESTITPFRLVSFKEPARIVSYYNTLVVFYYLVVKTRRKVYGLWLIAMVVGIVKSFGPYLLSCLIHNNFEFKLTLSACVGITINLFLLYLTVHNIAYFLLAIFDMNRKILISDQISGVNSIFKKECNGRLLPMINFLDFTSLFSWKSLLDINRDYGKKFFLRHQIFLAIVLIVTLTNYFVLDKNLQTAELFIKEDYEIVTFCFFIYFDSILFYAMFLMLLIKADKFNTFYTTNLYRLQTKILLLERVRLFQRHYLNNKQESLIGEDISSQLFSSEISDHLLKALTLEVENQIPKAQIDHHLEQLVKFHKNLAENLEQERSSESVRIFGIKISKVLIQSIVLFCLPFVIKIHERLSELIFGRSIFRF